MSGRTTRLGAALAALLLASACASGARGVEGRWQRLDQPSEWIEFGADGSFRSRSFTGTEVAGRYTQEGGTVLMKPLPEGHGARMTLADSLLVMEEGTRYRRVPR
ncbi:MAG TPA: hypothetical protein VEX86_10245 [Longimicrobium sp.]|nr:hypothetical protein [Longimicrobium sp.]